MSDFEEAAKIEILAPAKKETTSWVKRHPLMLIIPIILFVLIVVVVIILGVVLASTNLLPGFLAFVSFLGGGLLALFTSLTGRVSAFFFPPSEEPSTAEPAAATADPTNMFERFSSVLGLAGSDFVKPFQTAYEQILRDFNDLDHNVAVTFPLIEFFTHYSLEHAEEITSNSVASNVKEGTTTLIEDSYDFLKQVVWTKEEEEEEIRRVALAAFGPLGALVKAQVSSLEKGARNSNQAGKL